MGQTTSAQIINLVANDASKFEDFWFYGHFLWGAPLEGIITFVILSRMIGMLPTSFGFVILLLLVPTQVIFSRRFSRYRLATITCTDKRINAINEVLKGSRVIKMYNWEKAMEERIRKLREAESNNIRNASHLRAFNMALYFASLPLIGLAAFGGIWLLGYELRITDVFTALAFFGQLRLTSITLMSKAIERLSEMLVASNRIDAFMRLQIQQPQKRQLRINISETNKFQLDTIVMCNASFSWKGNMNRPCLSFLNLNVKPGQLVGIVGSVGVGKSSLLAAILGELNLVHGNLQVNGSVSYSSQSAWIFAGTIRANILLGQQLNEERYAHVLRACCLDTDFKAFGQLGDLMVIGENGVNLSGGQKARISLARALYADVDIYLLDDPLSAVDREVAKQIFDACIGPRSILREKTRLLVTHQIHFLIEFDQTVLIENGHFKPKEEFNQLRSKEEPINALDEDTNADKRTNDKEQIISSKVILIEAIANNKSVLLEEATVKGRVSWSVWSRLLTRSPLGYSGLFLLIFFLFFGEVLFDASNCWLAFWSSRTHNVQQKVFSFAYIYIALTLTTLGIAIVRTDYWFYLMLCGANNLHHSMIKGILHTSMRFFESNLSGRILNRASRDQQIIDEVLPMIMFDGVQELIIIVGSISVIGLLTPPVLLLLIPVAPTFWYICRYYLRTSRQLKRLESVARSPIYNLFSTSCDGLSTIRAFRVKENFIQELNDCIDVNTRAYITMLSSVHWLGVRLDSIGALFALITAMLVVIMPNQLEPSLAALSLIYSLSIPNRLQWSTRQIVETENHMVSAERIDEYGQLQPEEDNGGDKTLLTTSENWPSCGSIEFRNYTMRYRPESKPVLHNINLCIESKEKIGIIGRTGDQLFFSPINK